MWTEKKLIQAANNYYKVQYEVLGYVETDVIDAFIAGAKFIINNTQVN